MFEVIHTFTEWYDGPRRGIANYQGQPHLYESEWWYRDGDKYSYLLMPIDLETFSRALEAWAIWRRWETAFHQGMVSRKSHPALPEDRRRSEELKRLLEIKLVMNPSRAVRKRAEYQERNDPEWNGFGMDPLEVRWHDMP